MSLTTADVDIGLKSSTSTGITFTATNSIAYLFNLMKSGTRDPNGR